MRNYLALVRSNKPHPLRLASGQIGIWSFPGIFLDHRRRKQLSNLFDG
jgi:hypothetical protein